MTRVCAFIAALASPLLSAGTVVAAPAEHVCTTAAQASYAGETIACYSDAGCAYAEKMGGEPVRDFDEASAPFALARGKIAAIVTSSARLMKGIAKAGGKCVPVGP